MEGESREEKREWEMQEAREIQRRYSSQCVLDSTRALPQFQPGQLVYIHVHPHSAGHKGICVGFAAKWSSPHTITGVQGDSYYKVRLSRRQSAIFHPDVLWLTNAGFRTPGIYPPAPSGSRDGASAASHTDTEISGGEHRDSTVTSMFIAPTSDTISSADTSYSLPNTIQLSTTATHDITHNEPGGHLRMARIARNGQPVSELCANNQSVAPWSSHGVDVVHDLSGSASFSIIM